MSITRGEASIGFSSEEINDGSLPSNSLDDRSVQDQIDHIIELFDDMEVLVQGKANKDELRTLIAYSDEAIRIQAQDIALVGEVTLADVEKERNGTGPGNLDISITRIVGDVIKTGNILSNNWGTDDGTNLDLNNGTITIGGSNDPVLFFDGSTGDLTIAGTITAASFIEQDTTIQGDGRTLADTLTQLDNKLTETALSNGVDAILAGATDDFNLDVRNASIIAAHKDAELAGLGSGYSGTLRTGLAVTANGVAAGYNRKSDGAWVDSFAIDGTTGNASFAGTVTAESIIAGNVTVDSGDAMSTIESNAQSGFNIQQKLEVSGTTVLQGVVEPTDSGALKTGSITWDSSDGSLTGGTGVAMTEWGIIGANNGSATFSLEASTGGATFAGDVNTSGLVFADGTTTAGGRSATIIGDGRPGDRDGVAGLSDDNNSSAGTVGIHYGNGFGMFAQARGNGGVGLLADNYDQNGSGTAMQAISYGSGLALDVDGDAEVNGSFDVDGTSTFTSSASGSDAIVAVLPTGFSGSAIQATSNSNSGPALRVDGISDNISVQIDSGDVYIFEDLRCRSITTDNGTGGSGSAGAGNQYVGLTIDGVTYKLLHDGTL